MSSHYVYHKYADYIIIKTVANWNTKVFVYSYASLYISDYIANVAIVMMMKCREKWLTLILKNVTAK